MIDIAGSVHRSFIFPAERAVAYTYYSDVSRLLNYLPHISLVRAYSHNEFRMLYRTTELGTYHIRIFWDVRVLLDETGRLIRIQPLPGCSPIEAKAGLNASTGQGFFVSQSAFQDTADQTQVDYHLQLQARLPTPLGLRFMPGLITNRIARNIMQARMREIAEGFIELSIDAFPHWLAEITA